MLSSFLHIELLGRAFRRPTGRPIGLLALTLIFFGFVAVTSASAQNPRWEQQLVTQFGLDKYSPQVALDAWGNTHVVWAMKDPKRSGLQLFYATDGTGRFPTPYQITDTGTVFDSVGSIYTPYVFRLDSTGLPHVAFITNVNNHIQLFYAADGGEGFGPARSVAEERWYDMAVDSTGVSHIVWLKAEWNQINVYYWNSLRPEGGGIIAQIPYTGAHGDQVSNPDIEVMGGVVHVAFRSYSGDATLVYHLQKRGDFITTDQIDLPAYDKAFVTAGRADLRVHMALDSFGYVHIVAPHYDQINKHRLLYISNSTGLFKWSTLVGSTPKTDTAAFIDFDITSDGARRFAVAWDRDGIGPGLAELELDPSANWGARTLRSLPHLKGELVPPVPYECVGTSLAYRGDRIVVGGVAHVQTDSAASQVGLYTLTSTHPELSYILPDAAGPGMNVVVDAFAPFRARGSFGLDGFFGDTVALELVNYEDAARVVVGPSVVSWDGRLISATLFVKPGAAPGPVPLRVRVGRIGSKSVAFYSNVDTFFVVTPQPIGDSVTHQLAGGGVLGSGGIYGRRSKRGVLVVDSLILKSGIYSFDLGDVDSATPGNQGYLPVTLLSQGPIRIDAGAALSVSAQTDAGNPKMTSNAGPGGGGGGSGGEISAGSGYTGGGGPGWLNRAPISGASSGTGDTISGRWLGGRSLNGAPGGSSYGQLTVSPSAASGGGTAHPFGASGSHGQFLSSLNAHVIPNDRNLGGYGGGSAGAGSFLDDMLTGKESSSTGGGGGANGSSGGSGFAIGESNGASPVGSSQLVPLAGGGGGGGGGYSGHGFASGGGGGGALALTTYDELSVDGDILANGSDGGSGQLALNGSGGGAGAGGSILVAAHGAISLGVGSRILARGGAGGAAPVGGHIGGDGGFGRVRIDGKIRTQGSGTKPKISPASGYMGPSLVGTASITAADNATVSGYGLPGTTIRLYTHTDSRGWSYDSPREVLVAPDSTWQLKLGIVDNASTVYVAVLQKVNNPSRLDFASEPDWVMSPSSGAILGRPEVRFGVDSLQFDCIPFDSCITADLYVSNTGITTNLIVRKATIGTGAAAFSVASAPSLVPPTESRPITVQFCPGDTGRFSATLTLNTNALPDSLKTVTISGCAVSGKLSSNEIVVDLGELCIGDCHDTTVHLTNSGLAPLTVTAVSGDINDIDVQSLTKLPFTIPPGGAHDLSLKLCLKRFTNAGTLLKISNTSIEPVFAQIVVKGSNAGPDVDYQSMIDFGSLDLSQPDSCVTRTALIQNRSRTAPVKVSLATLSSSRFTVLSPTSDTEIPPLGSLVVTVRLCADTTGEFKGTVGLSIGDGHCAIDTVLTLVGQAFSSSPKLVIIDPVNPKSLVFPSMPIDQASPKQTITIKNLGRSRGKIQIIEAHGLDGTGDDEIHIDSGGVGVPAPIDPDGALTINVWVTPRREGRLSGRVIFTDDRSPNPWRDTVTLTGFGAKPGVHVVLHELDLGDICLHQESDRYPIEVYNSGSLDAYIDTVVSSDPAHFEIPSSSELMHKVLKPGNDTIQLWCRFKPTSEGEYRGTIFVRDRQGNIVDTISVTGRGLGEHIVVTPSTLDFGCVKSGRDSIISVSLTNTGACPVTISGAGITLGPDAFELLDYAGAVTIPPGGTQSYRVKYRGIRPKAKGEIRIATTADEPISIPAAGDVCVEFTGFELRVPSVSGRIGDNVVIPISARIDKPLADPVPYQLTLSYRYDLLTPLDPSRHDAQPPVVNGTLSSEASMRRGAYLGEVLIVGTLKPIDDAEWHTLVGIPMKVLLGATFKSDLEVKDVTFTLTGAKISAAGGTFTALPCDTAGGVVISSGKYALGQNYPNPGTPSATIHYEIASRDRVTLNLYDANGVFVKTLLDEVEDAGEHDYLLETTGIAAGVYTYELISGRFRMTKRMVIID